MKIIDLFSIFENKYNKKRIISGLRCKEKIHEDLLSESEASYCYYNKGYYHISNISNNMNSDIKAFNSSMNIISIEELESYLSDKGYI